MNITGSCLVRLCMPFRETAFSGKVIILLPWSVFPESGHYGCIQQTDSGAFP